jgi:dihydroorotase-like cyclic amidohydrolase
MSDAKRRLPIAITGATFIDGTRRPPLANATIVITGDRIARAGPAHDTPAPNGAEIIDGRGRFVIPGLTDMHVHVLGPDHWHAPLFLAAGSRWRSASNSSSSRSSRVMSISDPLIETRAA